MRSARWRAAESHGSGPQVPEFGGLEDSGPRPATPPLSPSSLLPFRGFPFLPSDPGLEEIDPQRFSTPLRYPRVALGIRSALSHSRKGRHPPLFGEEEEEAAASP